MCVSLGEPEHYAWCFRCNRAVGGPYFDEWQAGERRKEHTANVHGTYRRDWSRKPPTGRAKPKRDLFDVVMR